MGGMSLHLAGAAVNRSLSLKRKDEPDVQRLLNYDPSSGGTLQLPRKTQYAAESEPINPEVAALQRLTASEKQLIADAAAQRGDYMEQPPPWRPP